MPPEADRPWLGPIPFFVVKRGQKGRFRFTMRSATGSIRGEVFTAPDQQGEGGDLRAAYELVERLAKTLAEKAEARKQGSDGN